MRRLSVAPNPNHKAVSVRELEAQLDRQNAQRRAALQARLDALEERCREIDAMLAKGVK
jgi:hypothetical protein